MEKEKIKNMSFSKKDLDLNKEEKVVEKELNKLFQKTFELEKKLVRIMTLL